MSQVSIEYNGGVYLSQPYTVSIFAPLLAAAGRLLGFNLPQVVAQQNPELLALIASAPLMQFESRKAAHAELVEILNELFPLLPALAYIEDMEQLIAGLNTIVEGLQASPTPLTEDGRLAEQAAPTIGVTSPPVTVAPIVESSPTEMDGPPTFTTFPIDTQHAEMAGLFEPI